MDKELFEGLLVHLKKHGVKGSVVTTVSRHIVIPVGDIEVSLSLNGMEDIILGTVSWDNYIWVTDLTNDRQLGRLHEDGYKSHTHSYTYKGVKDLEEIITRLEADYEEFEYKREQEALERKSEAELLEERVNNFLYKG
uniref:Uncharacterized protein n=1 Tax=Mammaliicoccus phage MSShimriz1 TaxID=3230127 RepID=A0AAU8GV02_9VIRU